MIKSEEINELAAALVKVQGKLEGAKMDGVNPFFHSKYSTLASVWDACREPLSSNGLAVVQTCSIDENGGLVVNTTLLHSSGQWISGQQATKPTKDDPQGMGSAITYARRYGLAAMVGICPEDDDAEAATERKPQAEKPDQIGAYRKPPEPMPAPAQTGAEQPPVDMPPQTTLDEPLATEAQVRKIFAASRQMGYDDSLLQALMIRTFGKNHRKELTKKEASTFIEMIERGEGLKKS